MGRSKKEMMERERADYAMGVQSICQHCKYFKEAGDQTGIGWKCSAYPARIPKYILLLGKGGSSPHAKKKIGQTGDYFFTPNVYKDSEGKKFSVAWDWEIHDVK